MPQNIPDIYDAIDQAVERYCLKTPAKPDIIAVSKYQGQDKILPLLKQGHRLFGENYVQEAAHKWPELKKAYPDIKLHLVGPLQSNKAKEAAMLFDVIETLDRLSLAQKLSQLPNCPECYIQINIGEEEQKSGIIITEADAFFDYCKTLNIRVTGVMGIPPEKSDPSPYFMLLSEIAKRWNVPHISMGMSADFQLAACLGATHVRIGTALFGKRQA